MIHHPLNLHFNIFIKIRDAYMYKHANNIDLMIGKEFIGTYNLWHLKSKHNLDYVVL